MIQLTELKNTPKTEEEVIKWLGSISARLKKNTLESESANLELEAEMKANNEIR